MLNKAILITRGKAENFNNLVYKAVVSIGKMPNANVYGYYDGLDSTWGKFGEVSVLDGKGVIVGFFTFIFGVVFSTVDLGSTILVVNETTGERSKFAFVKVTDAGEFQYQTSLDSPPVFADFTEGRIVTIAVYNNG